ncbi:MAG TPA: potassium transporter TrkG, partial [Anaeromyxobacteraceae bacterium]|nr:potassium transporter TrkG [Anaeromyxobacteraceae bacterium]
MFLASEFALDAGAQPGLPWGWSASSLVAAAFLAECWRDVRAFRRAVLRHRWPDLFLAIPAAALFATGSPRAGAAFLVARLATRDLTGAAYSRVARPLLDALLRRPIVLLCLSFVLTIVLGTAALLPPAASAPGRTTDLLTALFTATSATCVTGLSVVDVGSHFSRFGHWVILILIQVGGLGLMTVTTALALLFRRQLSHRARGALQEIVEEDTFSGLGRLVASIALITLALEVLGSLLLFPAFATDPAGRPLAPADRAFYAAFHAVSAFCNAGFGLYPDNLVRFVGDPGVNAVVASLIVLGGLGFPV